MRVKSKARCEFLAIHHRVIIFANEKRSNAKFSTISHDWLRDLLLFNFDKNNNDKIRISILPAHTSDTFYSNRVCKMITCFIQKKNPFFLMKEIESTCTVRATLPDEIWFVMCVLRHSEKNRVRWNLKNNRLPTATRDEFRLQLIHQKWYTCF